MSEHTKGPWCWEGKALRGGESYCDQDAIFPVTVLQVVLRRVAGGHPTDRMADLEIRSLADKALIAAAPEMLAALEVSLDDDVPIANATVAIRAAIRKATGREPRQGGNGKTS